MAYFKLFIAQSLDGYIASPNGSIDWLEAWPNPDQSDYGYSTFYETIGTVLMGRKTYETVLSFEDIPWHYSDSDCIVFTHQKNLNIGSPRTILLDQIDINILNQLRKQSKKDLWVVGGGQLIRQFLELGAIDEMIISTVPILIGQGLPLFPSGHYYQGFKTIGVQQFESGITNLQLQKIS
ncbi:MAG: dihydrofolate reductase family protein [Bacteroidota bacterium]